MANVVGHERAPWTLDRVERLAVAPVGDEHRSFREARIDFHEAEDRALAVGAPRGCAAPADRSGERPLAGSP